MKCPLPNYLHALFATLSLGAGLGVTEARAQADYRNLDPGRPITIEDAQPVEFRALESEFGIPRFTRERRGHSLFSFESEFKWGVWKNTQFGMGSEYVIARVPGNTAFASRDSQFHLLYNFNQEGRRLPAIALRPELSIRSGGLGSRHEHGALKLILSKTLHNNRLHFNGAYTAGPTEESGRGGELVSRYLYGAAYERTLPLKFLAIVADVYARKPIELTRTEVMFEIGMRLQLTPKWVLDAGISSGRLRPSAGADIGITFGMSRSYSFRRLYSH
jgi:hypothetical protein